MIGGRTNKIIGILVYAMKCSKCAAARKKCSPVQAHNCPLNYVGSSKGMEATAALEMVVEVWDNFNGNIYIKIIVSDDDSTIWAKVSCPTTNEHGMLPYKVIEPIFKADPGHRIKSMAKPMFFFSKAPKSVSDIEMSDAMQYRMYIGCCIKKNRHLPLAQFAIKMKAPVEHMFGSHEFCDKEWCWAVQIEETKLEIARKLLQHMSELNDNTTNKVCIDIYY